MATPASMKLNPNKLHDCSTPGHGGQSLDEMPLAFLAVIEENADKALTPCPGYSWLSVNCYSELLFWQLRLSAGSSGPS